MGNTKVNTEINGSKYYRTVVIVGYTLEGMPIRKQFYGKTKHEADKKKKAYLKQLDKGVNPDLARMSLEQAMHSWLWNIEKFNGNKSSTFERYESIFRNYIRDTGLGRTIMSEVNKILVQKYYNELGAEGKNHSTISHVHRLLNKFFRFAVDESYVVRNPVSRIRIPKSTEEELVKEKEVETFSNEEIKLLLEVIGERKLKYIVLFALFTGARKGEILALGKSDISEGSVKINKTVKRIGVYDGKLLSRYEMKITKPKTPNSNRDVPLPDYLLKELKKLNVLVIEEKLKLGEDYRDNDLLFPSLTGNYIDERTLTRSWTRALERAGIPHKKFHALRHTYATRLFEKGVSILTVSRLLGHGSVKTTEIYTHVLENVKREEVLKINNILL